VAVWSIEVKVHLRSGQELGSIVSVLLGVVGGVRDGGIPIHMCHSAYFKWMKTP
jgi:hypothetical protein